MMIISNRRREKEVVKRTWEWKEGTLSGLAGFNKEIVPAGLSPGVRRFYFWVTDSWEEKKPNQNISFELKRFFK